MKTIDFFKPIIGHDDEHDGVDDVFIVGTLADREKMLRVSEGG